MKLVIVESPTKAKTISKFLGSEYKIESSFGHIRDLPKSQLGIDIENNFQPHYIIPIKAKKNVTRLKKEAQAADLVILATDEDREGEAISWHLMEALNLNDDNKTQRITFHEITQSAIEEALKHPRKIDLNLVNAQQARRILDRLVGYKLSPFLWEKIAKRLSAGRVQSVALRLICEREEEIKNFKPEEYWTVSALLKKDKTTFEAFLYKINDKALEKFDIKTQKEADEISKNLKNSNYQVVKVEKKEIKKNPLPPFTTSTLQQESFKKLKFSAKQTMRLAQILYENGLITYMRTDSLNLSPESVLSAKSWLKKNLGNEYATEAPRFFKTKSKLAQEAHEAIRPTNPWLTSEDIKVNDSKEAKLYELIWRRFMASQMPQAIFEQTTIDILAQDKNNVYYLKANGSMLKFDGFLKIWKTQYEEKNLPELKVNDQLQLKEVKPLQHFTEPPPRYDEASLIKVLEEYGIGRPSTYAPIISVIQNRNYVIKNEQRRFEPTDIGVLVNKILVEHFPEIVDIGFTAKMEDDLDEIAEGKMNWQKVINDFYKPFSKNLEKKFKEVEKIEIITETTNEICDKCGKAMVVKYGRFGKFLACSGFPECKNTKKLLTPEEKELGICPKCNIGQIIKRKTKKGRFFYGCSRYPDCDFASWKNPQIKNQNKDDIEE